MFQLFRHLQLINYLLTADFPKHKQSRSHKSLITTSVLETRPAYHQVLPPNEWLNKFHSWQTKNKWTDHQNGQTNRQREGRRHYV